MKKNRQESRNRNESESRRKDGMKNRMKDSRKKGSRKKGKKGSLEAKGLKEKGLKESRSEESRLAQGSLGGVRRETGDSAETEIRTENAPGCRTELLPEDFREKMRKLLGKEYEAYLESFEKPCHNGLRVNTMKLSEEDWNRLSPFQTEPVPWIENGFYYNASDEGSGRPSRHPYYYAGLYYLQEPSAMTPANLLPVKPGDRVLDICAAPGGKSTELGARLGGAGLLFSNDISNSRAKALLKNLEMAGIPNICVSSEAPEKLSEFLPEFFDCILVDAPCSGEGMFRREPDMIKSYRERGPEDYVPIQRAIMEEAVKMLRPGGYLLYSTCTFDREENEGTIRYILDRHPDMSLCSLPHRHGFAEGIGMPECVRLFPHRIEGEGHFVALLQRAGSGERPRRKDRTAQSGTSLKLPDEAMAFLSCLNLRRGGTDGLPGQVEEKNGKLYCLPPDFQDMKGAGKGIRFLRTGLLLGELKRGRFEPSQALAMALRKEEYPFTADFQAEDERVIRYLKGETVALREEEASWPDGSWVLVCTDGFPLGWAKKAGLNLKNKYYPGWRWQ